MPTAVADPRPAQDSRRAVGASTGDRALREPSLGTGLCPLYKVLLHNDDVTPYPFVLSEVCVGIFRLAAGDARRVTEEAHRRGVALAAVLPLEQAEFKTEQARSLARGRGYPLQVTFEPA